MKSNGVALISGGSRGLGLAMVTSLLEHGYRVATFSRRPGEAIERLKEKHGERFSFFEGDMSDQASLGSVVKRVEKDCGPIDVLINNAGIATDGVLATMQPGQIEQVIAVNLTGTLLLTRLVVRQMVVRSRGSIINISSIIGLRGYAGLAAYSATKAGLDGMTRGLARELGPRNIRVNSIAPGYLETEMTHGLGDTQRNQIVRRTPLGRLGTPDDVVGAVHFLLSPAAGFITGQVLTIDGGITC
ncbi:MAG: SDR family oxidoreductase [Nitrospira sp.]|nr:MAG: SDR family oxidoreductase [Nitrospira sp.]